MQERQTMRSIMKKLNIRAGWVAMALLANQLHADEAGPKLTVTASTIHSDTYLPEYAVDGNLKTRWASVPNPTHPEWLQIDLGKPCLQKGLTIHWEAAFAKGYEIQLSDDGSTWRTVFTQANGKGGREECPFAEQKTRFLRILCTSYEPHPLYSIWEMEFTHPAAQAVVAEFSKRLVEAEKLKNTELSNALATNGIKEIVFALRKFVPEHWYANIGYFASDANHKLYLPFGQLCKLDVATGKTALLLDDPQGGVRDPVIDYDARKIVFSYRKGGTEFYHLYEINLDGTGLKELTTGSRDDIEPCFLPDGGLVFVSTRGNRWVNCWSTQVAIIYRCDREGTNIRQLSANLEQDNTPWVLPKDAATVKFPMGPSAS